LDPNAAHKLVTMLPVLLAGAASATIAVERIASAVKAEAVSTLCRASLRRLLIDQRLLEIVGVWSEKQTSLAPGVRMSLVAAGGIPEMLAARRPIHSDDAPTSEVLSGILASEGVASWISIPLAEHENIRGVLTLSSSASGAFPNEDDDSYMAVAEVVEPILVPFLT